LRIGVRAHGHNHDDHSQDPSSYTHDPDLSREIVAGNATRRVAKDCHVQRIAAARGLLARAAFAQSIAITLTRHNRSRIGA
jgi:hypothetical protein